MITFLELNKLMLKNTTSKFKRLVTLRVTAPQEFERIVSQSSWPPTGQGHNPQPVATLSMGTWPFS